MVRSPLSHSHPIALKSTDAFGARSSLSILRPSCAFAPRGKKSLEPVTEGKLLHAPRSDVAVLALVASVSAFPGLSIGSASPLQMRRTREFGGGATSRAMSSTEALIVHSRRVRHLAEIRLALASTEPFPAQSCSRAGCSPAQVVINVTGNWLAGTSERRIGRRAHHCRKPQNRLTDSGVEPSTGCTKIAPVAITVTPRFSERFPHRSVTLRDWFT